MIGLPLDPSVSAAGECSSGWTYDSVNKTCSRTSGSNSSFSWTVPSGVTAVSMIVVGSQGGSGGYDAASPGGGPGSVGRVAGTVNVTAGTVVGVYVGTNGTNGANNAGDDTGGGIGGVSTYNAGLYGGGNGSNAGCPYSTCNVNNGNSGAGGGGGAATVVVVGGNVVVAAGGGGGGGASLRAPGLAGRTGAVVAGTNGADGDANPSLHSQAGVGGGGGGGANGGQAGDWAGKGIVDGQSTAADDYSAQGGSAGSNSNGGFASLSAGFVAPSSGYVTLTYTPQLAPIATVAPAVDATPMAGDTSTSTAPTFVGLSGTDTYQWLVCDGTSTASGAATTLVLPAGCSYASGTGANSASYVPALSEVGKYLRLAVTRTNGDGTYTTISPTSTNPVGVAPPSAPDLVAASDSGASAIDNNTNDTTPNFTVGTLAVGATVTITAVKGAETVSCSFVATAATGGCDLPEVTDGSWSVTATQTDGTTTSAPSSATTTIIDTIRPTAPLLPDLATASDSGSSSTDDITNDATPRIDTAGVPNGVTVTVTASRPGYPDKTCTYTASPSVTGCDLPLLADGPWNVVSTTSEVDAAGNTTLPSPVLPIVVRTTVGQGFAVDLIAGSDTGASETDELTSLETVAVGVPDVTDGDVVVMTATRSGQPSVSCTYTASPTVSSCDLGPLTSGVWDVAAVISDPVANVSASVPALPITVDLDPPAGPQSPDLVAASDSGTLSDDELTFASTPFIEAPGAEIGATVSITASRPGFADVTCTFVSSPTATGCELPFLADGPWTIAAVATDPAGNATEAPSVLPIVVDTAAPAVPASPDLLASSDSGLSDTDNITFDATPAVSLPDVEIDALVTLVARRSGFADVSCSYTVSVAVKSCDLGTLAEGPWEVSGSAIDRAGNMITTDALGIIVDTIAPAPVNGPDLASTSDSGVSDIDDLTFDNTPEIVVAGAESGSTVTVTATRPGFAAVSCSFVASASVSSCSLPVLADGPWVVSSEVSDVAGNVVVGSTTLPIVIDTLAPEIGVDAQSANEPTSDRSFIDLATGSDVGDSSSDDITSVRTPVLGIPGLENGIAVTLRATKDGRTVTCSYVSSPDVTGCVMPVMSDGVWSVEGEMIDRAGNILRSPLPLDVEITGVNGRPRAAAATGKTRIVNGADATTIRYTMPVSAAAMRATSVTLTLVDKNGKVLRTATFTPKPGQKEIELKVPATAGVAKVRVTTANKFGVSAESPAGANVLECPTSRGVDALRRPVLLGELLGKSVIFDPASPVITERGRAELERIVVQARKKVGRILVSGFARQNGVDTREFLRNLSLQRARNVAHYLSQRGVKIWIRYDGFGAITKEIGTAPDRSVQVRWTSEMIACPSK